ncbi:MAG TPA: OsmC family protein [Anaerolineales bacterium]|nr:OsmC family protein [Anaerolineales bacterium]
MTVTAQSSTNFQVRIKAGRHEYIADEPLDIGDDAGPDPYSLLLSSLAACTIMTVQMYARRKNWPLESVELSLSTQKIHAKDCEDCESDPNAKVDVIERRIRFIGELSSAQIERLTEMASKCPIHRTLTSETVIRTRVESNP